MESLIAGREKKVWIDFSINGIFKEVVHFEKGHINETYIASYDCAGEDKKYVHQRVNHEVFRHPIPLMKNIRKVTDHIRGKLSEEVYDIDRRVLTLVKTRNGKDYALDEQGWIWRTFRYIDNSISPDNLENDRQAYEVGRAYGEFQKLVSDLRDLEQTIPDFHNSVMRFENLERSIGADLLGRVKNVGEEIGYLRDRKEEMGRLINLSEEGKIPFRVVHNDTKCSNVLLDSVTEKSLCVVDLDTVMPGLSLYDFGDMVRSSANNSREDETDLSKVNLDIELFRNLAGGYLEEAKSFLNSCEKANLVFSIELLGLELGTRFLTDYLQGDKYFKTYRDGQNMDRSRVQLEFVKDVERNRGKLERIIAEFF